ncbi:MAG: anti-sigma factor [Deltaproteobacteria bacterium]|nr:anti-sigma factor [Deltaproteobacteria bacterium]
MITGKSKIDGGGEELPTELAENLTPADDRPDLRSRWYRRVSFWRSIAGMALALAMGCAAVAIEMASELSSRTSFFHHRLELLRRQLFDLRADPDDAGRNLAATRAGLAGLDLNRVLSATDVVVLRLRPSAGSKAHGMAAISKQLSAAIIEIADLPTASGQTYALWWLPAQGAPRKAAILSPDAEGRLSLAIQIPPKGASVAGAIVTLQPGKAAADRPDGEVMLRGELPRPGF